VDPALLTTDAAALVTRPDVDIVNRAHRRHRAGPDAAAGRAERGQVGGHGQQGAAGHRPGLCCTRRRAATGPTSTTEAAVAGAIPLLRPLRESLAGDEVRRCSASSNGTTNYILDRMDTSGADFSTALAEAQALGYAEADPSADVAGHDAADKAAILASIAFHTQVTAGDVYRDGITRITPADIANAKALGCVVKLLAICERCNGGVSARVHPAMIPRVHPLGRGARGLQRGVRGGGVGRAADVSTAPGRAASRRPAPCSATSSQWCATGSPGCAARTRRPTQSCRWSRSATR